MKALSLTNNQVEELRKILRKADTPAARGIAQELGYTYYCPQCECSWCIEQNPDRKG